MPSPALSLVGFMDQQQAIQYLERACLPVLNTPQALIAEWHAARAKLGQPMANAGQPNIVPIPPSDPHIVALLQQQWVQELMALPAMANASFQEVEIEPLLAYQHHIEVGRSNHHCAALSRPPTRQELLDICLPLNLPAEQISLSFGDGRQSVIVHSRSNNWHQVQAGVVGNNTIGLRFAPSVPLEHVIRFNGRCYLHNGFHRALGARLAGATHIPCVFRDVATAAEAAISPPRTFSQQLLESGDPPTLGHFTQGRAYDVQLRASQRVFHVSWAEYTILTE